MALNMFCPLSLIHYSLGYVGCRVASHITSFGIAVVYQWIQFRERNSHFNQKLSRQICLAHIFHSIGGFGIKLSITMSWVYFVFHASKIRCMIFFIRLCIIRWVHENELAQEIIHIRKLSSLEFGNDLIDTSVRGDCIPVRNVVKIYY